MGLTKLVKLVFAEPVAEDEARNGVLEDAPAHQVLGKLEAVAFLRKSGNIFPQPLKKKYRKIILSNTS